MIRKPIELRAETIKFRNTLREMAEHIATKQDVSAAAITAINDRLKKQSGFTKIEKNDERCEKRFHFDLSEPDRMLQPIAESAAEQNQQGRENRRKFVAQHHERPAMDQSDESHSENEILDEHRLRQVGAQF